jgi:hypothetical protein
MEMNFIHPVAYGGMAPTFKPAPNTSAARREIDFTKFSNENLKFTFDLLSLHGSPYTPFAQLEIQQRMARGAWLDLEKPPPPLHELPWVLTIFPLNLLHKQRKNRWGR